MILTAIFMALSVSSLSLYAALASRAKGLLVRPELSRWVSRVVGVTFIGFGAAILAIRHRMPAWITQGNFGRHFSQKTRLRASPQAAL
jgi:hypothetical protein